MRLVRIGPAAVYYRFLTPEWSYLPISGAGAARNGGRFNRPGVEALYLSRDVETALAEYRQSASITPPGTLRNALLSRPVLNSTGPYHQTRHPEP